MRVDKKQLPRTRNIRNNKRLSITLVVETLVFSLLISILVSAIQIYSSFLSRMNEAESRYAEIETTFLPSLSAGLWEVNDQRVDALLDSIANLPNVGRVYLIDEEGNTSARSIESNQLFSKREMELVYTDNGSSFNLGFLVIELSNEALLGQLKKQAIETATITSLTLFSSSLFILILFQRKVSRHLQTMAKFANEFDVHHLGKPLALHRTNKSQPDELDLVVNAINEMQSELQHELALRTKVEQTLRNHQENLEEVVKERTSALKLSIDQLAIAADAAALGVWQWNIHEDVLLWNEQMFTMYSHPISLREQGLNLQHWHDRVHPEDVVETAASFQAELQNKGKMKKEFRILLPNGQIRYIHCAVKVDRDANGEATQVIGINLDITAHMEIENNLREAKEHADAANAAKSTFLANMSHEIRTPMNAVLGMLQLLQQTELSTRQSEYLVKSQNAAKFLLHLLNDILDISKAEAGKLQFESKPFDLDSLIKDLAVSVSSSKTNEELELVFDIDSRIPKSIIGDKFRLQQVLINLIGNALKFTHKGIVSLVLEQTFCDEKEVQIKFSVTDTGIGISDEQISLIFEEFIQAEASTTRRFGGTGLGLVISKQLVQGMGGELKASSQLHEGSLFWFEITLELGDPNFISSPIINQSSREKPAIATKPLAGLSLLVVDDNEINREIAYEILQNEGAEVELADSGEEGVRMVLSSRNKFDLVLMDIQMPNIDGYEATRQIRADHRFASLCIIALTANVAQADIDNCLAAGMNGHIGKPFNINQIVDSILSQPLA